MDILYIAVFSLLAADTVNGSVGSLFHPPHGYTEVNQQGIAPYPLRRVYGNLGARVSSSSPSGTMWIPTFCK